MYFRSFPFFFFFFLLCGVGGAGEKSRMKDAKEEGGEKEPSPREAQGMKEGGGAARDGRAWGEMGEGRQVMLGLRHTRGER